MVSARHAVTAILRATRVPPAHASRTARIASSAGVLIALTASLSWSAQALAQATPAASAAPDSSAQPLQEVTVTGSRIKRTTDFTTPTPTTVIDATSMQNMGVVNVGQALEMTPANISNFTPANTGNSNFFAGAYIPDLRGLNPFFGSRTLTLIDTRRAVQTNQGDSFDLNFIPQILVQRIDTVTGGASAAYGSGAIGGVINVILDNKLEGGKVDADMYQTEQSDARDRHVSAAYGHSLFDGRVHFVLGGEFENQDGVGCENARSWCGQNAGLYTVGESPAGVAEYGFGTNLRNNIVSPYGAFLSPTGSVNTLQATPDGTGVMPYTAGSSTYPAIVNNTTVVGGQGDTINQYTNLLSPVNRGLLTGMVTAAVTDSINFNADLNWGKVRTVNTPGIGSPDDQPTVFPAFGILGQNIIGNTTNGVATVPNAYLAQLAAQGNPALLNAVNAGYTDLNKDWFSQINSQADTTTVVKRASAGFDGKYGDTSWTWDGYAEYGLTEREQLVLGNRHAAQYQMAMDSVLVNGTPECRVTAAGGVANVSNPNNPYYNPAATYTSPYSLATNSVLAQGCVPIDPFGNQQVSSAAYNYSFGELDEKLRYSQTVAAFNSSGDLWQGVGAGAFTAAAGFEWRQEVGHNDEVSCPGGDAACQLSINDFTYQFGTSFGGTVTVEEAYVETNLPIFKDLPWAHRLEFDIAARDSRYQNTALYGIDVTPQAYGVTGYTPGPLEETHNLPTWKVSGLYEPVEGVRLRASESRDSRAPNFRELYYGQVLQSGATGGFGYCSHPNSANQYDDPCTVNLLGNTNLEPEQSTTTTIGLVLTPPQLNGFQASADWFHIHITDAIEGASFGELGAGCTAGVASACSSLTFNSNYYNAAGGIVAAGTPGAVTGANAWQAGNDNVTSANASSYNGAFYDTRGVDFSVSYFTALPDGSTLSSRLLTTWTGEQTYQSYAGSPVISILGQTGAGNNFLNDNNPAARWTGNMSITWAKSGFALTPNVRFVGHGTLSYLGVTQAQDPTLYALALNGYANPTNNPAIAQAKAVGWTALPFNYVPSYFVFGLNGAYTFENIPGIKSLQVFTQINNVLNKAPPYAFAPGGFNTSYGGTNPIYFDTLGLAYRAGVRLTF